MGAHKFVSGGESYAASIWCEWCGLIIYQRNDSDNYRTERHKNHEQNMDCPNTPTHSKKPNTLIGDK